MRHLRNDRPVVEGEPTAVFQATEGFRVSQPMAVGDASMTPMISQPQPSGLAPPALAARRLGVGVWAAAAWDIGGSGGGATMNCFGHREIYRSNGFSITGR
jgi:hypothetical protein